MRKGNHKEKNGLFQTRSPSFGGRQITSLVLTRKFKTNWLKVTFLDGAENAVRLSIKTWFTDTELSTADSIWGLLFLFNNIYGSGMGDRGGKELLLVHIKFEMPMRFPSGDVK